jgi:hypothetical protein
MDMEARSQTPRGMSQPPVKSKAHDTAATLDFSIVPHSDGVTAKPLLSRKIHTDLRREIFCCLFREVHEKGRIFAAFPTQTGPEKMTRERLRPHWRGFSPEPSLVVRFQELGEWSTITKRTQRESQLTSTSR